MTTRCRIKHKNMTDIFFEVHGYIELQSKTLVRGFWLNDRGIYYDPSTGDDDNERFETVELTGNDWQDWSLVDNA